MDLIDPWGFVTVGFFEYLSHFCLGNWCWCPIIIFAFTSEVIASSVQVNNIPPLLYNVYNSGPVVPTTMFEGHHPSRFWQGTSPAIPGSPTLYIGACQVFLSDQLTTRWWPVHSLAPLFRSDKNKINHWTLTSLTPSPWLAQRSDNRLCPQFGHCVNLGSKPDGTSWRLNQALDYLETCRSFYRDVMVGRVEPIHIFLSPTSKTIVAAGDVVDQWSCYSQLILIIKSKVKCHRFQQILLIITV